MNFISRISLVPVLCGAAVVSTLVSCQQQTYPVFFLMENNGMEEGARFVMKHGSHYYTKQPLLSLNQFEKFCSYLDSDGTYCCELFIKEEYRTRLEFLYSYNQGKLVLPVVNGRALRPMKLDRPITDGSLVLWGVNGYDLKRISHTVKPINEEIEKKRYKDEDPRPRQEKPDVEVQTKDSFGRTIPEIFASQQ